MKNCIKEADVKFCTSRGFNKQRERISELEKQLKENERGLGDACSQGAESWHDNAPYEYLCEAIRLLDRRINEEYNALNKCLIREYPKKLEEKVVSYGARVIFYKNNEQCDYKIVGYFDNDAGNGRILYTSPIAQSIMGRSEEENFEITILNERYQIKIEKICEITDEDLVS
jgi:transcription elongation GreA/GreB family factor